jgi:hypothetical protein
MPHAITRRPAINIIMGGTKQMGLSSVFKRVEAKPESRNGDGSVPDNEAGRSAAIARALLDLVALVTEELQHLQEARRAEASESTPEQETKKPEGSK